MNLLDESNSFAMILPGALPHIPGFAHALVELGGRNCHYTMGFWDIIKDAVAPHTMLQDELEEIKERERGEPGWRCHSRNA